MKTIQLLLLPSYYFFELSFYYSLHTGIYSLMKVIAKIFQSHFASFFWQILFTFERSVMCGYSTWVNQYSFYRVNSFNLTNRLCKPWRFTKEHAKFYVHLQIYSIHYQHKKSFFTNHPRKDAINSFRKKTKHLFYIIPSNGCPSPLISDVFWFIMVLDAWHWYSNDLLISPHTQGSHNSRL